MKNVIRRRFSIFVAVLFSASVGSAQVVTDVSSSKNTSMIFGASPNLFFKDTDNNDYRLLVDGNVFSLRNIDGLTIFNTPPQSTIGIELPTPSGVTASAVAGGSLASDTAHYFVVTALDSVGETTASTEAVCTTTTTNKTCNISWPAVSPTPASYRVYGSTTSGVYTQYADVLSGTSYSATSFPLPQSGSPPASTTAYSVRLVGTGIRFSDGTLQSTASGAAAWFVPPATSNILSAQSGNVGIFDGVTVFPPDAKLTVRCMSGRCLGLNNGGIIASYPPNDIQILSNVRAETFTLWDTTQPSWSVTVGSGIGVDSFIVWRAPPTGGSPTYTKRFEATNGAFRTFVNTNEFGQSTSVGNFTVLGTTINAFLSAFSGYTANLRLSVGGSDRLIFTGTGSDQIIGFASNLDFANPPGGGIVLTMSSSGGIVGLSDIVTFGRVRGSSMLRGCATTSFYRPTDTTESLVETGPYDTGFHTMLIIANVNGYFRSNDSVSRSITYELRRNDTTIIQTVTQNYDAGASPGVTEVPLGASLIALDTPVSTVEYDVYVSGGGYDSDNYTAGSVRICAIMLP